MPVPNIKTQRLNGGIGRTGDNLYGIAALIAGAVAVGGGFQLNTAYVFKQLSDAEALGILPAYDTTNNILLHHHIKRFFARSPQGELWVMGVAQTTTQAQMADKATVNGAKKLLKAANGRIKAAIGFVRNPAVGYTPTITAGLDADVLTAIAKAQELIDEENTEYRYTRCVIEGRAFSGNATTVQDLRNIVGVKAPYVSVAILADNQISALHALHNNYAAVGDVLGLISIADISQNIGEATPEFNLTDVAKGFYLIPGLSSGAKLDTYSAVDLDTLNDKGFIFGVITAGLDGLYLNDSPTCTLITDDYSFIENTRVIDKMIEQARSALLPKLKSRVRIDETTGFLLTTDRLGMQDLAKAKLDAMVTDGDLSGGVDVYIDPKQNLLIGATLIVQITAVPTAIARKITIKVGFNNPYKQ